MNDACVIPPGKATGCLPRTSRPGERCPMAADRIPLVPESEWGRLADEITLDPFVKTVLDQDGVGSCASESSVGALMVARAFAGLPHVALNPWFVYHTVSGGHDSGSSIDDNLEFLMKYGCAPESIWPRSKGWRAEPSKEAQEAAKEFRIEEYWDIASVQEFVSALLKGHPVVWGAQGHAILAIAHEGTYPLIVNSWGDWGNNGRGKWASYSGINWSYGAWALRVAKQ